MVDAQSFLQQRLCCDHSQVIYDYSTSTVRGTQQNLQASWKEAGETANTFLKKAEGNTVE